MALEPGRSSKQFLAFDGATSLLQRAAVRLLAAAGSDTQMSAPLVVSNEEHRFTIVEQLRTSGIEPSRILLESAGRNTAPALALAAFEAMRDGTDPILIVSPADHAMADEQACSAALRLAVTKAAEGDIVILGVPPDRPETGYGYVRAQPADGAISADVEGFIEKPDRVAAERYLAEGDYFWNSGMFVLRASGWLRALAAFRPDIASAAEIAWTQAASDGLFLRFEGRAFAEIPAESIDYAVMEPASRPDSGFRVTMVVLDAGWSDLGAWDAIWRTSERDISGNASLGDTLVSDSRNTLVHATSRLVGVIGLDDITVVETADAVLVAHRTRSPAVKDMVAELIGKGRVEASMPARVHRPWGWYEAIAAGPRFQVKRILVKPGAQLSLQMHHHRTEHWVVVSGTATVTNGETVSLISENQSIYIPIGQRHRLANPGKLPLEIIEVQSGSYLGEDDIVRFEDNYGRS